MEKLRREKNIRHAHNLSIFTGFLSGKFWENGVPRVNKNKLKKKGNIFRRGK